MSSLNVIKKGTILRVAHPIQGTRLILKKGTVRLIRIGIQGPPGPPGEGGAGATPTEVVIPAGETRVIDTYQSDVRKWILSLKDTTGQLMSYEILCSKVNSQNEFTKYGLLGDRLNHSVDFVDVSPDTEFQITNNLLTDLTVTAIAF